MAQMQVTPPPFPAEQNETQAPRPRPQPRQSPRRGQSMEDMLKGLEDDLLLLRRGYAGYSSFMGALYALRGEVPEGERVKGTPLLSHQATANGHDSIEVATDLKRLPLQQVDHVLPPLIYIHAGDMWEAIKLMEANVATVRSMIEAALPPEMTGGGGVSSVQPPPQPPSNLQSPRAGSGAAYLVTYPHHQ